MDDSVYVVAIETEIEGKEGLSCLTQWGYGKQDIMPPLIIPVEQFETIQIHELRFEQWLVTGLDADGDVRIADMMRDVIE